MKFPFCEFVIFELFVVAFNFVKFPVIAVSVFMNAVANARIFPEIFVTVVEAKVDDPETFKFVFAEIVVVELVKVAFVAVKDVGFNVTIERLVIVAFVIVELVTLSFVTFEVEAFDVDA